ncbi:hypothetical protein IJH29_02340 [Candidatus Saccharibacteria bacterium]|nr:hypothetical protein [Candidatus Saccharibacteria bacterium]
MSETIKESKTEETNEWNTLEDFGAEHPFEENIGKQDNQEVAANQQEASLEELSVGELRQLHIDWMEGKRKLSDEEYALIIQDEDFYTSEEYKKYRKEVVNKFIEEHQDIYEPNLHMVAERIRPGIEAVRDDKEGLLRIGEIIKADMQSEFALAIGASYFAKKFGVKRAPMVTLVDEDDKGFAGQGAYNSHRNEITCRISESDSVAQILDTLAHETWHARQHESEDEKYKDNFEYYCTAEMDYDGYRKQLVELEAFSVGEGVARLFRRAYIEKHADEIKKAFGETQHE